MSKGDNGSIISRFMGIDGVLKKIARAGGIGLLGAALATVACPSVTPLAAQEQNPPPQDGAPAPKERPDRSFDKEARRPPRPDGASPDRSHMDRDGKKDWKKDGTQKERPDRSMDKGTRPPRPDGASHDKPPAGKDGKEGKKKR